MGAAETKKPHAANRAGLGNLGRVQPSASTAVATGYCQAVAAGIRLRVEARQPQQAVRPSIAIVAEPTQEATGWQAPAAPRASRSRCRPCSGWPALRWRLGSLRWASSQQGAGLACCGNLCAHPGSPAQPAQCIPVCNRQPQIDGYHGASHDRRTAAPSLDLRCCFHASIIRAQKIFWQVVKNACA